MQMLGDKRLEHGYGSEAEAGEGGQDVTKPRGPGAGKDDSLIKKGTGQEWDSRQGAKPQPLPLLLQAPWPLT